MDMVPQFAKSLPPLVMVATAIIVMTFTILWLRKALADGSRAVHPALIGEWTYGRMRERYLEALKQTTFTQGLAILLVVVALLLLAGGLAILRWDKSGIPAALLASSAAAAALAVVAFITSTANRRHLLAIIEAVRIDWRLKEAVRLAETVPQPEVRMRLVATLALQLSGSVPTASAIREILARHEREQVESSAESEPARASFARHFHFRQGSARRGRRLVLERDHLA